MKTHLLTLITTIALSIPALAGANHAKKEAGPNGGRILPAAKAEFLVLADRKVQITFLDAAGKPAAPADQVITVTAGERSAPTKLTFTKSGATFTSEQPLPAGEMIPAVIQIKPSPDASAIVEKFNINTANCPGCNLAEYACTCAH